MISILWFKIRGWLNNFFGLQTEYLQNCSSVSMVYSHKLLTKENVKTICTVQIHRMYFLFLFFSSINKVVEEKLCMIRDLLIKMFLILILKLNLFMKYFTLLLLNPCQTMYKRGLQHLERRWFHSCRFSLFRLFGLFRFCLFLKSEIWPNFHDHVCSEQCLGSCLFDSPCLFNLDNFKKISAQIM